jgi:two-component system sensor histidine kinase BarA
VNQPVLRGGIGQRIAVTFAVPMLVVILSLGWYITGRYMNDTRDALQERGSLLAKHLAALCELGMYSEDLHELTRQGHQVLRESDVTGVEISNAGGDVLVQLGQPANSGADATSLVFNAPIVRTGVAVSDFEADLQHPETASPLDAVGAVQVIMSTNDMLQARNTILETGITLTVCGLLVSLLLATIVSRRVAEPIVRLTGVVRKLTGGDLSARAGSDSPGELGVLELGVNQMASSLEDAQRRMQRRISEATAQLTHTVNMLEARNLELEQARADAVDAGNAKSEFLARMSHEIRTPLSAVIGFAGLLQETKLEENQQEHIRTIMQAASQLLQIIDDILGYTRLDSNTMSVDPRPFDLHETLENVVSMLSGQAHEKRLELVLYIHSDVPQRIVSDPTRISQVLTNLVNNAIKFTTTGHVLVEVSVADSTQENTAVTFAVTDTGIGMSESQQQVIFDPFTQADVSISRRYGGTGLGLTISSRLVALLGGEIGLHSSPGKGSTFSFTIRVPVESPLGPDQSRALAGYKVVVYDRNPFTLRSLRNRFFNWGAKVFNTSDRNRLVEMLVTDAQHGTPCDLLVMGLAHDEYDAIPETDWLLDVRAYCQAPIIVLLGTERHDRSAGDCRLHILPKPPRSERLLRAVRSLLPLAEQPVTGAEGTSTVPDQPPAGNLAGLHLLVAEDNPFNQQLFLQLLANYDIDVTIAVNGREAIRLAAEENYDLIFMDIHMPVMGGAEAMQEIRQGRNRNTPVIALTADVFVSQQDNEGTAVMDDILYKPVSGQKFIAMIRKWCVREDTEAAPDGSEFVMPPEFRVRLQEELRRQLAALREAVTHGHAQQLADHLHQIKGLVGYCGLPEFTAAAAQLENAVQDQAQDAIVRALEHMERLAGKQA